MRTYRFTSFLAIFSFLVLFFAAGLVRAQPSGGPYGPIDQRYEVPKAGTVYFVAPDGKSDAAGTDVAHPTTIEAAIERVVTGDAIVLRGGTYRTGGLVLNQGITIQPYEEEHPVLKGTEIATQWEALPNNVWRTHGRICFRRSLCLGGIANARGRRRRSTVSTSTWFSSMASFSAPGVLKENSMRTPFTSITRTGLCPSARTPRTGRWRLPPGTALW